ncbi:hypothetical protein [Leucobacter sp.]
MAKIRSLKPEFFSSEQIVSVSIPARYLFEGIWVFGDDEGLIKHSPMSLKMKVFPGDSIEVEPLISELLREGLVVEVESEQGPLLWAPNVQVHQSPKRPTPTKFASVSAPFTPRYSAPQSRNVPPAQGTRGEPGTPATPPNPPHVALERRGEEGKGEERSTSLSPDKSDDAFPIPEEWRPNQDHCDKAAALHLDVVHEYNRFREHAERKHRRLKNWNAGFTNWLRKQAEFAQERRGSQPVRRAPAVQDNLARLAQLEAEEQSHHQQGIEK